MPSIKCPTCGFIRFATEENCKRCSAASDHNPTHKTRPVTGAWRDRRWLVKHLEVPLDETCIKCGETADISHQRVKLKAYSAWSLLTQVVGVRIFRWLQFEVPLCRRHRGMDKLMLGIMGGGAFIMMLGIAVIRDFVILSLRLFGAGFLTTATGFILYLIRRDRVSVWRYKHPYVWLWGVHRSYLERVPNWSREA